MKKYADFSGRSRRKEYWMFAAVNFGLMFIVQFIGGLISPTVASILGLLVSLPLIVPGIAVAVRRMHDVGKSGWWLLVMLVPILGFLYILYLAIKDGQPEANQWGG